MYSRAIRSGTKTRLFMKSMFALSAIAIPTGWGTSAGSAKARLSGGSGRHCDLAASIFPVSLERRWI